MKTSAQLRAEIAALQKEMNAALEQERMAACGKIEAIMVEWNITLADLHRLLDTKKHRAPRPSLPPKFRHPDGRTWSGQGRMPSWLVGENLDNFRIAA